MHDGPVELLQRLIRFDTSNPPGNERPCIEWARDLLEQNGCSVRIVARDAERPSLVARLAGEGRAPGLLLQGHVDVVPAEGPWSHPPFGGEVADGYVWGRGALDMKGGVAMMIAAFLRAAEAGVPPLHNTASATVVRGGYAHNVIPGEVSVDLDCRLLPGFRPDDVFRELRALAGVEIEFEVVRYDPGPPAPDQTLFDTLAGILRELDPQARPVPLLLPGVTDGRFFARLGIQTYGFLPMQLPPEMRFLELVHGKDERIPVDALEFGTSAIRRLLERLGERTPPASGTRSGL